MGRQRKTFKKESITVAFAIEQMRQTVGVPIRPLNSVDLESHLITESSLNRPGLALAGYVELFTHHRVQLLGNTECRYLSHLSEDEQTTAFNNLLKFPIPCIILTEGNELDERMIGLATNAGIPLFVTPTPTIQFMVQLRDFLGDQFALQQSLHGSLIDVYGIGMLIVGTAGIGKSEVALDLVERGHRLVADDVVIATRKEEKVLMGSGTDLVQHFMEIRGLGLVDVRAMFGIRAIRFQKRIEVVVNLHPWDPNEEYTRLGMAEETYDILGVELPLVMLPITPGKNVTVLCEVIGMNHLLRNYGYDPAEVFSERLAERIRKKGSSSGPSRGIEYFEHDYE
ncbi:MAG: HPr kinase/phosphorylase [Bacteroidetes Order II. Incertae sedis bacterium]|jgi:HPr kinase/phosphorylase|nr:HPr kinase/phosphorylase [Bacteroidetes Order II. bacterium]MDG2016743.1 HPr(Ser) kinase/phosphatase [Rhodothermales bacterium]HAY37679.1 HPr kinase/phosphorylase [Bacteroidota bacterium]MBT4053072.1 HPr kinase/phosphorylase [Bacteroidetes Order II. bacterium]MBT4602964.1 HPr kinase/phosphorylase [Bacteroidetes Order II. bacterium]